MSLYFDLHNNSLKSIIPPRQLYLGVTKYLGNRVPERESGTKSGRGMSDIECLCQNLFCSRVLGRSPVCFITQTNYGETPTNVCIYSSEDLNLHLPTPGCHFQLHALGAL